MSNNFKKNSKGFTLVETLVAISIFSVSILSLLAVLANGLANTNYAKKKLVANSLAQEGIEYMRNMRDTYVLYDSANPQTGWNSFSAKLIAAGASCQNANGCYFNDQNLVYTNHAKPMANLALTACSGTCPVLSYDSLTGKYIYAGAGANAGYIRKITVVVGTNEIKVTSTVSWVQGSGTYSAVFSETLFNWVE